MQFNVGVWRHDDLVNLPMPPRILVVDDDPGVRSILFRYLSRRGCSVEVATNGVEALAWLGCGSFDAIITDIQMPSMDGAEFWRQTVVLHPWLRDRFLFCSALPIPAGTPRHHSIRFLQKPFELVDLWAALADLLGAPPSSLSDTR